MGVVVRRYIDILTIIINFPCSTCISSFLGSSIPTSLFIFKMFFLSCFCYFFTIYSKRYSKNIRDRSKKSRSRKYNYLIISIIKNVRCLIKYLTRHAAPHVWSAVCVKTQDDAGIYNSCWYLRFMLVFMIHAGIYTSCWYRKYQHEV